MGSKNIEKALEELIELVYPEYIRNEEQVEQVEEEASNKQAENRGQCFNEVDVVKSVLDLFINQ